ncbi:hypothetical protein TNCV_1258601 [Trichonephila clavipes]|nr:hypothetical protein TNCV_1258601 [Trichonephila clavipes]
MLRNNALDGMEDDNVWEKATPEPIPKIGFAYCQWGAELLSLLCRPVCKLHSLSSDNKQWPHGHVHRSFHSWLIVKHSGTIDG